jgi:hypothetical protein
MCPVFEQPLIPVVRYSVGGLAATILFSPAVPLGPGLPEVVTALAVWLTSTAFADLFITGFLVKFLVSWRFGRICHPLDIHLFWGAVG